MTDPFKTTTKQELNILGEAKDRRVSRGTTFNTEKKRAEKEAKEKEKETKNDKQPRKVSELYNLGLKLLEGRGYIVELDEMGDHINHRVLRATPAPEVDGIRYPQTFTPYRDISKPEEFIEIEKVFEATGDPEVVKFWEPLHRPKAGDSDLLSFTERMLKMKRIDQANNIHKTLDYGHTFDPEGKWGGSSVLHPRIWVPDRDWFDPVLHKVTFADVFTIFPKAEQEMLQLILGRVGVGRANHLPPGRSEPVDHTARMAGVIVGKDAGLGKSTLFNGLTAALQKCGFVTHTFKSTEDRFGLKAAALSDVAYKDDTSLTSLKKFLAAEETKILITNGLFQVEEKFLSAEQIWPKSVILVNSNDWNSKFAYDLDPGIIDRIKIISTYREYEVAKNREHLAGTVSEGSPDLRPRAHIPYLANKLGVSQEALYLWCLRLGTDRFWEVINDTRDPSINRLQVEVRYWTTRQRIRFKADVTQALVNGMAFSWMLRTGDTYVPELTPQILQECLEHFYYVGVDPSGLYLVSAMKKHWEDAGRPSTHYYQGFREIRWESIEKSIQYLTQNGTNTGSATTVELIKEMMERLVMRDGFKIGGSANYVIENWENMRHASEELQIEGQNLLNALEDERDVKRLTDLTESNRCYDKWLKNKHYSPDRAEKFRAEAREKLYASKGV
jgi:hypothetical protein